MIFPIALADRLSITKSYAKGNDEMTNAKKTDRFAVRVCYVEESAVTLGGISAQWESSWDLTREKAWALAKKHADRPVEVYLLPFKSAVEENAPVWTNGVSVEEQENALRAKQREARKGAL